LPHYCTVVVPEIMQLFESITFNIYDKEELYGLGMSNMYGVDSIVAI
jgi:hypothetical protein